MNKNKISNELLQQVSMLSMNKHSVFVSSSDFNKTKNFLKQNSYKFIPYRFAKCFYVEIDNDDLSTLSNLEEITLIHTNAFVQTLNCEQDFMNIKTLTQGKFFGQNQTICFIDTGIHPHFDFIFPYNRIIKYVDLMNKKKRQYSKYCRFHLQLSF